MAKQRRKWLPPNGDVVCHLMTVILRWSREDLAEKMDVDPRTIDNITEMPVGYSMDLQTYDSLYRALNKGLLNEGRPQIRQEELLKTFSGTYIQGLELEKFSSQQVTSAKEPVEPCNVSQDKTELNLLRYLVNALYQPGALHITEGALDDIPDSLEDIGEVIRSIRVVLSRLVVPRIGSGTRAYFAYKLSKSTSDSDENGKKFDAYYRIGISSSKQWGNWKEGLLVGKTSNLHRVYNGARALRISDTYHTGANLNQHVRGERSVYGVPVLYDKQVVGVFGLSSLKKDGTAPFVEFGKDVATYLSCLFFAFGRYLQNSSRRVNVSAQIRERLAGFFELYLKPYNAIKQTGATTSIS